MSSEDGRQSLSGALREILLQAISEESERRWAAGWMMGIERTLWLEGGKWRLVGEHIGWPSGYEAPWISAAEADALWGRPASVSSVGTPT